MMSGGMRLMRPHFVDPQTNIVYDTNSADFEGWLTKQSSWLKVQCRKQIGFVLVCMCMYVFIVSHLFCSFVRGKTMPFILYLLSIHLLSMSTTWNHKTNSCYHLVWTHTHTHVHNCWSLPPLPLWVGWIRIGVAVISFSRVRNYSSPRLIIVHPMA